MILSAGSRRGGNSDTLCDEFMRGVREAGNETEKVFLRDKPIHYCTGFSMCSQNGKPCLQKDEAAEIIEKNAGCQYDCPRYPIYFYAMST